MISYHIGSTGPEVERIQRRLAALGRYAGAFDGQFGGGTEGAVRAFQRSRGLDIDGEVGAATWTALFGEPIAPPAIASAPLDTRCLVLTSSFETGAGAPGCWSCVAGNFDGMGMSFGALQWNFGTSTLGALLRDVDARAPHVVDDVFHEHAPELRGILARPVREQVAWARARQDPANRLAEPWAGCFKALGRTSECQDAQRRAAADYVARAGSMCARFGVWSERGAALMFDIAVQNGSIKDDTAARIDADFAGIPKGTREEVEVARLIRIAERRAEAVTTKKWVADVRERKLMIANGGGTVHGRRYDLEGDYGIGLRPFAMA
jgi:hypothetical protein